MSRSDNDIVAMLRGVVVTCEAFERISNLTDHVRRINESTENTVERLVRERQGIAELLRRYHVPNDAFDHKYSHSDVVKLLEDLIRNGR